MSPEETIFCRTLEEKLSGWGVALPAGALDKMAAFYSRMVETNKVMNLTGITAPEEAAVRHFADALNPFALSALPAGALTADVGTGAGFPGMPLAIARPDCRFVLVDSMAKRTRFLEEVVQALGLTNVTVCTARAEDFGRSRYREKMDAALSRAVAPMNVLLEYTLPLLKRGGVSLAYKGPAGMAEAVAARHAAQVLGGADPETAPYSLADELQLCLVVTKKVRQTSAKYPRRNGIPQKTPL